MERKNSYSRMIFTSAARVASVKNNHETLLLARARKGLSSESNGTLRNFYRERVKANNFLQNVNSKSTETLKSEREKDEKVTINADKVEERIGVISRNEVRDIMKAQRRRRASLDISRTEETQRRIQEFLSRDIPGSSSRNEQLRQLDSISDGKSVVSNEFEKKIPEDDEKTNAETPKPFRIRSRTSGICFSCSHGHLHCLPPAPSRRLSVPNMARKSGSEEYRLYAPLKSSKTQFRKLSVPMPSQVFLNQNRIDDVNTSCISSTGTGTTSRGVNTGTSLKPAGTKKCSI